MGDGERTRCVVGVRGWWLPSVTAAVWPRASGLFTSTPGCRSSRRAVGTCPTRAAAWSLAWSSSWSSACRMRSAFANPKASTTQASMVKAGYGASTSMLYIITTYTRISYTRMIHAIPTIRPANIIFGLLRAVAKPRRRSHPCFFAPRPGLVLLF